jgi:hypothetical protein
MMKRLLLVCALLAPVSMVEANICALDVVPAATLLFPYVVFDYNNPVDGANTVLSITNLSSQAQIVHVQLWSDTGEPVLGFNIVLSGYDLEKIDIRELLVNGTLPVTGTTGSQLIKGKQPYDDGPVSHQDGLWLDGILPPPEGTDSLLDRCSTAHAGYPAYQTLSAADLGLARAALTASQLATRWHNDCQGTDFTVTGEEPYWTNVPKWWELRDQTEPTWMYVTADVVWDCQQLSTDDPGYWSHPHQGGRAWYQNVLTGDVEWTAYGYQAMDTAVHIEADQGLAEVATRTDEDEPISFYYRYSTLNDQPSDAREPLPNAWAMRYSGVDSSEANTYIRAWKSSTTSPTLPDLEITPDNYLAYACYAYTYFAWDEDEGVILEEAGTWTTLTVYLNLLPLAAQEIPADDLETPSSDGWFLFIWPVTNYITSAPITIDPPPDYYQTWMGVRRTGTVNASGAAPFSTAAATVVGNANCFEDQVLPELGVNYAYVGGDPLGSQMFADGFESGDTGRWSGTVN